jgi:hypothetical protein
MAVSDRGRFDPTQAQLRGICQQAGGISRSPRLHGVPAPLKRALRHDNASHDDLPLLCAMQ